MDTRKHELRPDPQGRYRPYLGWKIGEDGVRRQHRFNLGTDKRQAEYRFAKIRQLYEENCRVYNPGGDGFWSPRALSYAELIARGQSRIIYPPLRPDGGFKDP